MHATAKDQHSYLLGTGTGFLCDVQILQLNWDTDDIGVSNTPPLIDFNLISGLRITNNGRDPINRDAFIGRALFLLAACETVNQIQLAELLIAQHTIIYKLLQPTSMLKTHCVTLMTHDKRIPLKMRTILREMVEEMAHGQPNHMSSRSFRSLLRAKQCMVENMHTIDEESEC